MQGDFYRIYFPQLNGWQNKVTPSAQAGRASLVARLVPKFRTYGLSGICAGGADSFSDELHSSAGRLVGWAEPRSPRPRQACRSLTNHRQPVGITRINPTATARLLGSGTSRGHCWTETAPTPLEQIAENEDFDGSRDSRLSQGLSSGRIQLPRYHFGFAVAQADEPGDN